MNKNIGCLIIHGFNGSVQEVEPLEKYLSQKGYNTFCPQLKGHTGKKRDMASSSYVDWMKSAEDGFFHLKFHCDKIAILGFSMGGLIAFNIAERYGADAIVTMNTPIYVWDKKRIMENIKGDFKSKDFANLKRYMDSAIGLPVVSFINFKLFLERTKPLIKDIACPALIIQAMEDDTVQSRSAEYIHNSLASKNKELKYYGSSGHQICHSPASEGMFEDIEKFLNGLWPK